MRCCSRQLPDELQGLAAQIDLEGFEVEPGRAARTYEALKLGFDGTGEFLRAEFFSCGRGILAVRIQARLADLVADIDQFGDQAAQVLACGDLVASGCELGVGDGPGAGLAVDAAGEDPARAVAGVVGVGAAAVGLAALAEGGHERAGAQVAEVGELQEELLSTGGKGFGGGGGIGHEARESGSIIRFQTPRNAKPLLCQAVSAQNAD